MAEEPLETEFGAAAEASADNSKHNRQGGQVHEMDGHLGSPRHTVADRVRTADCFNETSSQYAAGDDGQESKANGKRRVAGTPRARQEIQRMLAAQLDEFDSFLKALRTQVEKTGRKAKADLNEEIKNLERDMAIAGGS